MGPVARLALAALVASCAGGSVSGSVGGRAIDDEGAGSKHLVTTNSLEYHQITVFIGGKGTDDLCVDLNRGRAHSGSVDLILDFGGKGPLDPGDFDIGGQRLADVRYATATVIARDELCKTVANPRATAGKITVSSIVGDDVSGSFTLAFGADTVTGSFNATGCIQVSENLDECVPP